MEKLKLADSAVAISRLGFGCARLFDGAERRRSAALIEAALESGIRHFDTAPAYGSEDLLGTVLRNVPDATVATKIGLPRSDGRASGPGRYVGPLYRAALRPMLARVPRLKSMLLRAVPRTTHTGPPIVKRTLRREDVMRELEDSLRRLRRPSIDLYLLHEPERIEMTDELRETFLALQRGGLIGAFGLAFGAQPTAGAAFGGVVQCRFADRVPRESGAESWIFHGVLRGSGGRAAARVAGVLARHPEAAVIFSASTVRQIAQISASCRS